MFGTPMYKWNDNIKIGIKFGLRVCGLFNFCLAQNRLQSWALFYMVMNLWVLWKMGNLTR
jgi:hypothetical protein